MIAFDNSTTDNSGTTGGGNTYTFSHTTSGSNRILFLSVTGDTGDNVTGATYGGVAMTLIDKQVVLGFGGREMYLFCLVNPANGANNVVVSAPSGTGLSLVASSYNNSKQTGQPDSHNKGTQSSTTSFTISTTTVADNCWLVAAYASTQNPISGGTGTTVRTSGSPNNIGLVDSNGPKTPAGSKSLIITSTNPASDSMIIASFAPAPAASQNGAFLINLL